MARKKEDDEYYITNLGVLMIVVWFLFSMAIGLFVAAYWVIDGIINFEAWVVYGRFTLVTLLGGMFVYHIGEVYEI